MGIPPNAQDATPMFVMMLRELSEIQAGVITNQLLCQRILELVGEDPDNVKATTRKIYDQSRELAMKQIISRLKEMFPDAPPEFFRSLSE